MKTQNGFTLLKGVGEITSFLNDKKVTRNIDKIQIHHMALPDYKIWEETDKKKFDEPHFGRTNSTNEYGKNTWGSKDENGKYIAQHFSVFPDGYITSGRSLNNTPIGIKGWNTGAICIEIYGNFDDGKDQMTQDQKKSVIELVGELCKHFDIKPSESTMRYHAWFASDGSYLGDYIPGKSRKSCPGTNFFGGNTIGIYNKNFLPVIKDYINPTSSNNKPEDKIVTSNKLVRITTDELNIRQKADADSLKLGSINKGEVFTIIRICGDWGFLKSGAGWIHLGYTQKI